MKFDREYTVVLDRLRAARLWMDSYEVLPGQTWEVAIRADNPGVWMAHCHNLQHAAEAMMLHLTYDGLATGFRHHGDNHPE